MTEYTIYGTANCTYCDQAKKLLEMKGLPYSYMDAPSSLFFQTEFVKKQGIRTVPQIFVTEGDTERHVGGFEELMKELM